MGCDYYTGYQIFYDVLCAGSYDYCRQQAEAALEGQWVYYTECDDSGDDTGDMEYVSKADFDALVARVERLEAGQVELGQEIADVDDGVVQIATAVAGYLDSRDDTTDTEDDTEDEGEVMTEVVLAVPGYYHVGENAKCPNDPALRTFKIDYNGNGDGLENCAARCFADAGCNYFSVGPMGDPSIEPKHCIGCTGDDISDYQENYNMYQVMTETVEVRVEGRRHLSELQQLREENARLRELLKREL